MRKIIALSSAAIAFLAITFLPGVSAEKIKLQGYITAKPDRQTLKILDDVIHFEASTKLDLENAPSGGRASSADLDVGILIEAEGTWKGKHHFSAQKIKCDWDQFDREIKESAYLDYLPEQADKIPSGKPFNLRVGGELLVADEKTKLTWEQISVQPGAKAPPPESTLAGFRVSYRGVRRLDGTISAREVEFGPPPPENAFRIPDNLYVVRAKDQETGIEVAEFWQKNKLLGKIKLFPVSKVQEYVTRLGTSLAPRVDAASPLGSLEFRFIVVEDAGVSASSLHDGTIIVNTGLLGILENEAQLAFVLSHEIAHVTQAHRWRLEHDTRTKRISISLAAIVVGALDVTTSLAVLSSSKTSPPIGQVVGGATSLADILEGMWVTDVYGAYERQLENQADRIALQSVIARGYEPRQAVRYFATMIDRYGGRSTSALRSPHASNLLIRGSFLATQIMRQYPQMDFSTRTADTEAFRAMREAMGPVKSW